MKRLFVICLLAGCGPSDPCDVAPDEVAEPVRYTPRWAFEPWISKDISSTDDTYAFVEGFAARDIPVGAVVLDSPWETHYNTFVPNPVRYHHFDKLVADLHARNIKVVLWITQMVNSSGLDFELGGDKYEGASPNHAEALACKYLANRGDDWVWWKGTGGALDFFDSRAVAWWHRQQDPLYALGLDGWKLDFGDSYVMVSELETAKGMVSHQAYSEAYYRDFLAYGKKMRGRDFVTMVRGWDESYYLTGRFHARPEHAPVVWAGDNRRDWVGLADALHHMFKSAQAGYAVVGSDVGGYLDFDDKSIGRNPVPESQDTFARWTGVGAMTPFMQLHGRANLTPWTIPERPDETVELYRYWSKLHHELVPFFYTLAAEAHRGARRSVIAPVGTEPNWNGDYRFTVGDAFLVAPILDDTGRRDVPLIGGDWYDWWNPAHPGGTGIAQYDATDRRRIPLFVKRGAIVPMVSSLQIWPGPATTFTLLEEDGTSTRIDAKDTGAAYEITLSRTLASTTLRVRADRPVTSATVDGAAVAYTPDAATRTVTLTLAASPAPRTLTLTAP
jgi:alpha-glucosidase (family GH31 glycosyl hydrolase)